MYKPKIRYIFLLYAIITCFSAFQILASDRISELSLKELIEDNWDKNLFDLEGVYPFGTLMHGDIQRRVAANYFLKVRLTDLGLQGDLRFHQLEETLRAGIVKYPYYRALRIEFEDLSKLESACDKIVKHMLSNYPKIYQVQNPGQADLEFRIQDFDSIGGIIIEIYKGYHADDNVLVIGIQHSESRPIGQGEYKQLLKSFKNKN